LPKFTPFPVHGLDKALGLKKTRISDAAFIYACYGVTIGALATWYMMNHDWPQNIGGKPAFGGLKHASICSSNVRVNGILCCSHDVSYFRNKK
jgi:hypothetical protein